MPAGAHATRHGELIPKTGDAPERMEAVAVDLGKKVGKGAVNVGGNALSGLGSLAKRGGKKLQDAGETKSLALPHRIGRNFRVS